MTNQSKEIIERIKQIETEQKRRRNSPLGSYNSGAKVHEKQMAFHRCKKRNRWVFGGNRSGKTECGAVETVWLARGIHPFRPNRPNVSCWVVSLSAQVQRDVAQRKLLTYLPKEWIEEVVMNEGRKSSPENGVIDYLTIRNVFGGKSRIGFKNCEAGRDKFQGASLDFVWFDEEPPKEIYDECRMRVLDKEGEIFGTMTPLKGLTWVYDEIFLNKSGSNEVWCCFMEWADNPFLSQREVDQMTASLSDDQLESRRYGRFRSVSGMVYPEFDENVHVIPPSEIPPEWQDAISIDPGLNNPTSCHWYARDGDGVVYVVAEHYEAGRDVEYHAERIKQISQRLGWKTDKNGRYEALIDSAARQRTLSGMRSVAELFFDNGVAVNTRVNKDVAFGVNVVKSFLKKSEHGPKIYIFKNCQHLISELKGYFWGDDDKPKKVNDHAVDELRYYLCSLGGSSKGGGAQVCKTEIQRDKERLARSLQRRLP